MSFQDAPTNTSRMLTEKRFVIASKVNGNGDMFSLSPGAPLVWAKAANYPLSCYIKAIIGMLAWYE